MQNILKALFEQLHELVRGGSKLNIDIQRDLVDWTGGGDLYHKYEPSKTYRIVLTVSPSSVSPQPAPDKLPHIDLYRLKQLAYDGGLSVTTKELEHLQSCG